MKNTLKDDVVTVQISGDGKSRYYPKQSQESFPIEAKFLHSEKLLNPKKLVMQGKRIEIRTKHQTFILENGVLLTSLVEPNDKEVL